MLTDSKEIKFGYLISHTFPGLILILELIVGIDFLTPKRICFSIFQEIKGLPNLIVIIGIFLVSATILGIIIDAIQHLISEIIEKISEHRKGIKYEFFVAHKKIKNMEQLKIYNYFVDYSLWYYYESYFNIGLSLIPGIFVVPGILRRLSIIAPWTWLSGISILIAIIILIIEARITYNQARKIEGEFGNSL